MEGDSLDTIPEHGFDVIDMHHHIDVGVSITAAMNVGRQDSEPGADRDKLELETRLRMMDQQHVRGAIMLPGHTYLRPRGLADTMVVNDAVAAYRDKHPDRFVAALGVVEPLYGPAGYDEVVRCRDELGLVGISFHNGMQGVPVDTSLMRGLLQKIGEAGMVPFIHAVGEGMENIWQVDTLAKDFPDLTFVCLDVFRDIVQLKSLPEIAERRANVYFDLALSVSFDIMGLPQVRTVGADRFLYGSNLYSWPMMTNPFNLLPEILRSDLSDDQKTAIFSGNIKRLLDLN
jgi:predicted TIM-barrel fold metal-dependent hydrolase